MTTIERERPSRPRLATSGARQRRGQTIPAMPAPPPIACFAVLLVLMVVACVSPQSPPTATVGPPSWTPSAPSSTGQPAAATPLPAIPNPTLVPLEPTVQAQATQIAELASRTRALEDQFQAQKVAIARATTTALESSPGAVAKRFFDALANSDRDGALASVSPAGRSHIASNAHSILAAFAGCRGAPPRVTHTIALPFGATATAVFPSPCVEGSSLGGAGVLTPSVFNFAPPKAGAPARLTTCTVVLIEDNEGWKVGSLSSCS